MRTRIARWVKALVGYPEARAEPLSLEPSLTQIRPHFRLRERQPPQGVVSVTGLRIGRLGRSPSSPGATRSAPPAPPLPTRQDGIRRRPRGRPGAVNTARALAGGRITQDNPGYQALKAYGVIPPPAHDLDWRMSALDDGSLDRSTPAKIMEMLANISPEVSRALWDFLRLANPGFEYDVYRPGTETTDRAAKKLLDAFWERIKVRQGTADVLIGRLFISAFLRGAFFAELVLDESGTLGLDIATPDPETVRFKVSEDPVNEGPWVMGQWQSAQFVILDRETVQYIPVDPFPDSPYGRAMVAPAMFSTLFLIGLLHDLRRVIVQQGYPRIDVVVHLDQIFKRMPERIRENEAEQEQWANDAIKAIQDMYRSLQPDDALVHDDSFEVKGPVGTVDSSSLGSVDGIITMLERMAVRSLKTMPLILCITDGVSEANANRQWEIMAAGVKSVQHHCETLLERLLELELQAEGVLADVKFRFSENRSAEELRDQQTLALRIANYIAMQTQGWVDQDEAAMTVIGHAPALDEPPAPVVAPAADDGKDKPAVEDPEPGSKRTLPTEVARFRLVMEQAGYGRIDEWLPEGRHPNLDSDERIEAVQRTGERARIGDAVYFGWDVYFRADPVIPKGSDGPLAIVPNGVEITGDDIDRAVALWDRSLPEYTGVLDADPV